MDLKSFCDFCESFAPSAFKSFWFPGFQTAAGKAGAVKNAKKPLNAEAAEGTQKTQKKKAF
ncbi:MAG TPA: hypothetical protein VFE74_02675 [Ramlibacter sp.]|nr:hypothetical protein [Ramlibacter sp.]